MQDDRFARETGAWKGGRALDRRHISFRDDGRVFARIEQHARARGLNLSDAARELVLIGFRASAKSAATDRALIPEIHDRLGQLLEVAPASSRMYSVLLVTVLECVMLHRQLLGTHDKKLVEQAQRLTREAFEELCQEGTVHRPA